MREVIGPVECRVLGCLMEKQVTVPASYPLTLNSVVTACNQASGREPVMTLSPTEVEAGLDALRALGYTRKVHASHGSRVVKHRHVADEVLGLDPAEQAVLTVLLLRGAQTPGELRSRTDRLYPFAGVDEVGAVLDGLAQRDEPLVVVHDRRPGQKEQRWSHLLGGPPADDQGPAAAAPPARAPLEPAPDAVRSLAPFVGRWVGDGEGSYPTIEPFGYTQEIELAVVPGKPFLAYRSSNRLRDGRPSHTESGFLRVVGPNGDGVELVVAQGSGLVEAAEGFVADGELLLVSTTVAGTTTAKDVVATERRYSVEDDRLTVEIAMAAVGVPLTHHLRAHLRRT